MRLTSRAAIVHDLIALRKIFDESGVAKKKLPRAHVIGRVSTTTPDEDLGALYEALERAIKKARGGNLILGASILSFSQGIVAGATAEREHL